MPDLPSISVVIPTYNRAHGLEPVLRPLMADPTAEQLIVVIDGSTDDSLQVAQALAREDSRVSPLVIANSGEMAAREASRRDGIEAVVIVTPNHLHHPVAKAFLEAGIDVICDKPLATIRRKLGKSRLYLVEPVLADTDRD